MKKYIIAALAIVALLATTASAEVYNFGQGDLWAQLKYAFNATTGHDHDGENSKKVVALANTVTVEGATEDAYETSVAFTDPTADRTVTVADQSGTVYVSPAATALTAGAAVTLTVAPGNRLYTDTITTDNQDQTITFSGAGTAGDQVTIIFVTDAAGSGDEVITFHSTLCRSTGTLTLANAASSRYLVRFISDGSKWNEVSRTAVQAA